MIMVTVPLHANGCMDTPEQLAQPHIGYAEQQIPSDNTVCGSNTWHATLVKIGAPSRRCV